MLNKMGRPDFLFFKADVESSNAKSYSLAVSNTQMLLKPTVYFPGFRLLQYAGRDCAFVETAAVEKKSNNIICAA